jgi:hypothetical protein
MAIASFLGRAEYQRIVEAVEQHCQTAVTGNALRNLFDSGEEHD